MGHGNPPRQCLGATALVPTCFAYPHRSLLGRRLLPEEPNGEPNASAAYAAAEAAAQAAGCTELHELRLIAPPGSALVPAQSAGTKAPLPLGAHSHVCPCVGALHHAHRMRRLVMELRLATAQTRWHAPSP